MTKRIVLCADDFGQAPEISQGIVSLISAGRLSATSCMVNTACWKEHAKLLIPYKNKIDIGLHFNLTEGKPLSDQFMAIYGEDLFSLPTLMQKAFLHRLDKAVIQAECHAQLDCFEDTMGCLPDFVDGHQHIHQFPMIRTILVTIYERRLRSQKAYLRLANEKITLMDFLKAFKKVVIYLAGARAFKRLLDAHHIPHNSSFAGIYSFDNCDEYGKLFPQFLQEIGDGGLIMCHPGFESQDVADKIAKARYQEYQYLASDQFLLDCKEQDISLTGAVKNGYFP